MLFVKRVVQFKKGTFNRYAVYGVLDTDTGVEKLYTLDNILGLVHSGYATEIGGVTPLTTATGYSVSVYQHPAFVTKNQLLLKMFYDIDLVTFKDDIVAIEGSSRSPVTIRLSEYGRACGVAVLLKLSKKTNQIVFVLDDSLKIDKDSFAGCESLNVKFDIREVKSKSTLAKIYNPKDMRQDDRYSYYRMKIIDDADRFALYVGRHIIKNKQTGSYDWKFYQSFFDDPDRALEIISEDFRGSFKQLTSAGIHSKTRQLDRNELMVMQPLKSLFLDISKRINSGESAIDLWIDRHTKFESVLRIASSVNVNTHLWFLRYFKHLHGTDEFRRLGEKYVSDIVDWYLNGFPLWN